MRAFTTMLSSHTNFWNGDRLVVSKADIRKMSKFSLHDPTTKQLASSSATISTRQLGMHIEDHYNKNKKSNRLQRRDGMPKLVVSSDADDQDDLGEAV